MSIRLIGVKNIAILPSSKYIFSNLKVRKVKFEGMNNIFYEYYLKAKYKWHNRKTIEDKEIVRGLLNKAIELDDNFIAAKKAS